MLPHEQAILDFFETIAPGVNAGSMGLGEILAAIVAFLGGLS
ncbi:hypothetical protein [uncultured Corynebacterium sp.]|nr:hypothetical protein [uncultured Corynebacterium sp.]